MKFGEVFRYELEHRVRSPSTWIYAAILFGLAVLITSGGASPSNPEVHVNAPSQLAFIIMFMGSVLCLPVSAAFFGDAAVRDIQAEMDPLLFTSPLRKAEYLGGRYLAAATANAVVVLAFPLGLAAPVLLGFADPTAPSGPFRVAAYAQPYLLFLLPNMAFAGAVLFATGVLTRRLIPVYLAAIGLFIGTVIVMGPDADDVVHPVLSVLGPLGFHAWNELTRYWTAAERNALLIGFPPNLVWNRVFWLSAAATVLVALHRRFRFAHPDGRRRRLRRREIVEAESELARPVEVARVTGARGSGRAAAGSPRSGAESRPRALGSFGFRTTVRQTLAVARNSLAELVSSRWFIVVLLACVILTLIWGWNVGDTVFDTSTWPVTLLVAEVVLSQRVDPLVYMLIAVYAGELVWKDRDDGVAEIADAAPVPEGAALLGRFLALVAMLVMFQAAMLVGGILIQAFQGYYDFEPGLYLRIVFGLNLADYMLVAALAMTIHVLVNHKNLGHMIVLLAIVFTRFAGRLGFQHHLLLYGTDPGWTYSDMNGFGPFIGPFVWFKLYWAAWALLLAVVACVSLVRGRESGMRHRLRQARARFTGPVFRTAGVAMALILVFGGFIFYNTNILNEYRTTDEVGATQAEYEKRYGRFRDVLQPMIESAGLRVEIYPDERAVDLRGSYRLVNRTGAPIDSVHVFSSPVIVTRSISFDRAARAVLTDEEAGYRIYVLDRPLEPDESMGLSFDVAFRQRGFPNSGIQTDVVDNGAYFDRKWLPFIGYQPAFELSDDEARERLDLERRATLPGPRVVAARRRRYEVRNEDKVRVETIIGTSAEQTAITPGVLRREWTEDGRRYFHYEMEAPQFFSATVFSGRYAVHEDRWNDVALRVFYHPDHDYNLNTFVRSMKASLDYFTTQFGPYEGSLLRIVEIPRYGRFGRAHPHTIAFTEDNFFGRAKEGQIDQLFFGTAHEVAHQWWGGQIRGATGVLGSQGFLSESLANFSALMVTEKAFGIEAARRAYAFQLGHYFTARAAYSDEVPILEMHDQPYLAYRKGLLAMYLMRDYIGEDAVNTALRRFVDKHRAGVPPYPTALDVVAELRAVTPDSLQYLLTDLFEMVTLWDVRTQRAAVSRAENGEYVVTLDVVAKKMRADRQGYETEVPMDDVIEIGVFAPGEGSALGEPLYIERHSIRSGAQTIRISVPREPARAGIDPYRKLIDREGGDNVVEVETARAPAEIVAEGGAHAPSRLLSFAAARRRRRRRGMACVRAK